MHITPDDGGWLAPLTNWFKEQIEKVWHAFADFMNDLLVSSFKMLFDVIAMAIEALPVPDFIANNGLGDLLGQSGSEILWFVSTFQIGPGLALIAGGYVFRLTRKFLTLFQW